jgi:hypothetical protein
LTEGEFDADTYLHAPDGVLPPSYYGQVHGELVGESRDARPRKLFHVLLRQLSSVAEAPADTRLPYAVPLAMRSSAVNRAFMPRVAPR